MFSAKVIIASGLPHENGLHTELIDFQEETQSQVSGNYFLFDSSTGGYLQDRAFICGGDYESVLQGCSTIGGHKMEKWSLLAPRSGAAGVILDSSLWIVGGFNGYEELNTTEFVSVGSSIPGPALPLSIRRHAMVKFNEESVYIIGGKQNGSITRKTWIVNPKNEFEIQEGPPLIQSRFGHSIAKFVSYQEGRILIVIAGGTGLNKEFGFLSHLNSTEILDPMSSKGWTQGKLC